MPPMATSPTPTSTSTSRITSPTRPPLSCRWYRRFASYARPGLVTMLASPSPPPSPLATRHSPLATHHSPLNLHPHQVYFLLSTNLVIMLALELRLGLDPAACCSPRWNGCPWLGRLPLPPWVGRLVLRSALLSSQVLVRVRVRRRSSLGLGLDAGPRAAAGCIGLQPRAPRPAPPILSRPPGAVTPRVLPGYHPMATGPRGTAAALGRG